MKKCYFIAFALVLYCASAGYAVSDLNPSWWNSSWAYRQEILVSNDGAQLSDYQIKVVKDFSYTFDLGRISKNCSDLRFTYYNASTGVQTSIPFWIEDCKASTSGNVTAWIKVPYIGAVTKLFMYYGKKGASNASNAKETFDIFEDFSNQTGEWSLVDPQDKIELDYNADKRLEFDMDRTESGGAYKAYSVPENFVYEFTMEITDYSGNCNDIGPAVGDSLDGVFNQGNSIGVLYAQYGAAQGNKIDLHYRLDNSSSYGQYVWIDIGTVYYPRLTKSGNNITLEVFSDSARNNQVAGSPVSDYVNFTGKSFGYVYLIDALDWHRTGYENSAGWIDDYLMRKKALVEPLLTYGSETPATDVCQITGDNPPCGTVTISEIVSAINYWATGDLPLNQVLVLINAWAE